MTAEPEATAFADLGVSGEVIAALGERGIRDAFPIQVATIEAALSGRDICGKAPTGSGKTLAFGIPVIDLTERGTNWRPKALILAPTRELATQIKEELAPLAKERGRSIMTAFGGTNIERDIRRLEKGIDILVACPGRLEDLIARRCCELRDVNMVVVDEADRMADMGFLPAVKRLLDQTPDHRHTLLFSATLDGDVDTLIKRYQIDPLTFEVEEQAGDIGDVEHSWYLVQPVDRISSTVAVLRGYESSIVFCRTRRGCERVAKTLASKGLEAVAIHGDRSQGQRERALKDFISGKAHVLVATDVAARGIHVDSVALVMHYDPAGTDKDYIHRSGRTGRAGQDGRVISMVVEDKKKAARQLQKELGFKPGFDDLDITSLPPAISRPKPKPEPKQERSTRDRDRGQSNDRDGSASRNDRGKSIGKGAGSRNRKHDHGGSRNRNDRDDRGRSSGKGAGSRNRKDRDGRRSFDGNRDRGERRPDGKRKEPRRRPGSNDWFPPGYHDDDKPKRRTSGSNRDRDKRDDDRKQGPAGGSNTAKRKSRDAKGRHADKSSAKNKGKRRKPRNR